MSKILTSTSQLKISDLKNIIVNDTVLRIFLASYKQINFKTGCYYMGYFLEDTENLLRIGFTTNTEWGKEYLSQYINQCHLWPLVNCFFNKHHKKDTSLILPWETASPKTSIQKDIILRREELLIGRDGISFCKKFNSFREYYYFAPEVSGKNFIKHMINNLPAISNSVQVFRNGALMARSNYFENNIPKS